jgi:leucyl aminopeptidase
MAVTATSDKLSEIDADAIVIGIHGESSPAGPAEEFNRATGGLLTRLIEAKEITGKKCETVTLLAPPGIKSRLALVVGLGAKSDFHRGVAFRAASAAAKTLGNKERSRVAFFVADHWPADMIEAGVCGSMVGCVGQDLYRAKKNRFPIGEIVWGGVEAPAVNRGQILGEAVNLTRRLVNEPPSEMYPESFAAEAAGVAQACGLAIEVWDQARLEAERCGSLVAVARGSSREPRLVILRYNGAPTDSPPLAFVGKGVTFDSGGLSIKPSDGMKTMKCDMAGAATVLGAMQAIAQLKLPVNVVGLCGLVENMVSGNSYKLGDVLRARSGKTIEVLNTDAEGRLVLADALAYAARRRPDLMLDFATLTAVVRTALGTRCAAILGTDHALVADLLGAAAASGEMLWELPLIDEYRRDIDSRVADLKNVGEGAAGTIVAALFLREFVGGVPWAHIDFSSTVMSDGYPCHPKGASGYAVRTVLRYLAGCADATQSSRTPTKRRAHAAEQKKRS